MVRRIVPCILACVLACACGRQDPSEQATRNREPLTQGEGGGEAMMIEVKSAAFEEAGMIPKKYTADGDDVSPPLSWSDLPEATKSVALLCDDPDAPVGDWVHWVIFNMPADTRALEEAVSKDQTLSNGAVQGTNGWGEIGYRGPAPPGGTHRYFFKLYALDAKLNLPPGASKADLLKAMKGHVLAEGRLMGKYTRD